ncbi:MAG: flagellar hook-basal body complex protein FliE [Candidatus Azotimanducaceae bacterium]|jgi:flagellar hook-basal body complex protein FliE
MSDRMDIQNVLAQMRTMKLQAQGPEALARADRPDTTSIGRPQESTSNFGDLMTNALDTVNDLQKESGRLSTAIERGDQSVTLTQAMIASQKASVAFQSVSEARNKLVSAYEKIMNMPI